MTSAPVMYTAEAQRLTEDQLRSILQQRGENPFGSRANLVEHVAEIVDRQAALVRGSHEGWLKGTTISII